MTLKVWDMSCCISSEGWQNLKANNKKDKYEKNHKRRKLPFLKLSETHNFFFITMKYKKKFQFFYYFINISNVLIFFYFFYLYFIQKISKKSFFKDF